MKKRTTGELLCRDFFELSDSDKTKIEEAKDEAVLISNMIFSLIDKKFEDTTELERQVLAAFCFGMINAIIFRKELNPLQGHSIASTLLTKVFHYSEEQAEDFTQELINSTDESYHPVMFSIIRRGLNGYQQYVSNEKKQLQANVLEVLAIVNES